MCPYLAKCNQLIIQFQSITELSNLSFQRPLLYARYLCSRDALGLKAKQPAGQARRATIGYLVYKDLYDSKRRITFRLCLDINKCRDASNALGAENQMISSLYRVFIVVCVRRISTFVTKDNYIFYHAERNKLRRVFSMVIDLVKAPKRPCPRTLHGIFSFSVNQ